jgi:hypothetical protein
MQVEQPRNIFSQFRYSLYEFKAYPGFMQERGRKVFLYSFLLIIFTYLCTFVYPLWGHVSLLMGIDEAFINENIPYFELADGRFFIEEPIVFSDAAASTAVYITSDEEIPPEKSLEVLSGYAQGFVIDSQRMIIKQAFQQPREILWSSIPATDGSVFNRADLHDLLPVLKAALVIMYIIVFVLYIGIYMFAVLVCSLLGMAINTVIKAPVGFPQMFKLAAYARTVPIIVKMILFVLPFGMTLHPMLFYALFGLYMVWALLAVKKASEIKPDFEATDVRDYSENN